MDKTKEYTNRLASQKSPYLLQHAHNPVDWYPWGPEAFQKAAQENKPIFLSIGYSTCHWCHVMEHESFEDPAIAKILNDHFVSIKVDREERPDLDSIYMNAVMAMVGQGGWPLSVFLTPDKKPFYGGTYFPPHPKWGSPGFSDLLLSIHKTWEEKRNEILESSRSISEALQARTLQQTPSGSMLDAQTLTRAYEQLERHFDFRFGGFGQAPKFPMGHNLSFLLRYGKRFPESKAILMVEKTLTAVAAGGIYDHLGGGFHRYATDQRWNVPHFEKMLYDQAILSRTYLEAYQATGKVLYAEVARQTFDYVLRDMQAKEGGFFCAEDADSLEGDVKKEGAFYVWRKKEIDELLDKTEAPIFHRYFGIEENGNASYDPHGEFTGKNILFAAVPVEEVAAHFKKTPGEIEKIIEEAKEKLFNTRLKRPRPHLDDKILTDWNGLMMASLATGGRVLNDSRYLEAAGKSADFILKTLIREDGRLLHRYRDGEAAILGTLEDYAFFIYGLLELYEAGGEFRYLRQAERLGREMIRLFWDEEGKGFYLTATDSEELISRPKEIYDGALPSANSVAALDLLRLYHLTLNSEWDTKGQELFAAFSEPVNQGPGAYTQLLSALDFEIGPAQEIVVASKTVDKDLETLMLEIYRHFVPNKVVLYHIVSDPQKTQLEALAPFVKDQTVVRGPWTVYICENHVCQLPLTDLENLKKRMIGISPDVR